MYYLLLGSVDERTALIEYLKARDIYSVFHYIPLHSSPMGKGNHWEFAELPVTQSLSDRLLRLPLWLGLEDHQERVIQSVGEFLDNI
jgi:dTDP-4-amino-4,6-dideoxygalactose transaminase